MRIQVSYEEISQAASALGSQSQAYQETLMRICSRLNQVQSIWQGADSQAFMTQLESLQPKMLQLKDAVDQYAALLSSCAAAYAQLQSDRAANARLL